MTTLVNMSGSGLMPVQNGVPLRDQLPPPPGAPEPRKIPTALVDAVRAEMSALVAGDIGDDLHALAKIAELAQRARELFAVVRGHSIAARAPSSNFSYGGSGITIGGSDSSFTPGYYGQPEQFGARAIRELVSLLPELLQAQKKEESPAEIAEAMKIASEEGDEELRLALRSKLMDRAKKKTGSSSNGVVDVKAEATAVTSIIATATRRNRQTEPRRAAK